MAQVDRRAVLGSLVHGTCALAALCAGCGPEWREATVLPISPDACGVTPGGPEEGWVEQFLTWAAVDPERSPREGGRGRKSAPGR